MPKKFSMSRKDRIIELQETVIELNMMVKSLLEELKSVSQDLQKAEEISNTYAARIAAAKTALGVPNLQFPYYINVGSSGVSTTLNSGQEVNYHG